MQVKGLLVQNGALASCGRLRTSQIEICVEILTWI